MTSALTLSASQQALVQSPMTSDIPAARRAVVRAYPMPILRCATSCRADGMSDVIEDWPSACWLALKISADVIVTMAPGRAVGNCGN